MLEFGNGRQLSRHATGGQIPHQDSAVARAGDQCLAVGSHKHVRDQVLVTLPGRQAFAGIHIPETDRWRAVAGQQRFLLGRDL